MHTKTKEVKKKNELEQLLHKYILTAKTEPVCVQQKNSRSNRKYPKCVGKMDILLWSNTEYSTKTRRFFLKDFKGHDIKTEVKKKILAAMHEDVGTRRMLTVGM